MKIFCIIALKNLVRSKNRTFILSLAIIIVAFLLSVLLSLIHGIETTIIWSGTSLATGHVNIAGFYKLSQSSASPIVVQYNQLKELAKKEIPEALFIIDRVKSWGKIISESDSVQIPMWGVDIAQEKNILCLLECANPTDYIDPPLPSYILKGQIEDLKNRGTIAIFASHAKKLKVRVGDMLTISMPTYRNMSNTKDLKIVAVLKDMGMMSQFSVFLNSQDIREVYQIKDDTTGQIMIYLKDRSNVKKVEERLRRLLAAKKYTLMDKEPLPFWMKFERVAGESWTGQKIDITTWEDETSFLKWILILFKTLTFFSITVLSIIIIIGLINALWMSVKERISEIGTLRSIGMQRYQILLMILLESFFLSLFSSAFGIISGGIFVFIVNKIKIPLTSEAFKVFLMSDYLKFQMDLNQTLVMLFCLVAFFTIGSIFPAIKAAKLRPITAINSVS